METHFKFITEKTLVFVKDTEEWMKCPSSQS